MSATSKKDILAVVEIPNVLPFDEMAGRLGYLIGGIIFEKEEAGRFDEVPAFVAKDVKSSAKFILFGIPEGENSDAYTLELTAETYLPIQEFKKSTFTFLNSFLAEKTINSRGYIDYSDELANALAQKGIGVSKSSA